MEKHHKVAALYIATLKAISLIHQQNHLVSKGKNFYGNHLLFERLYKSSQEDLDSAAEKFIGLFGDDCLNYDLQIELLTKVLSKYKNLEGSNVAMSIAIEKDFIKLSQEAYKLFRDVNQMSLGLDDLIMSISSNREEAIYLLQQILKNE